MRKTLLALAALSLSCNFAAAKVVLVPGEKPAAQMEAIMAPENAWVYDKDVKALVQCVDADATLCLAMTCSETKKPELAIIHESGNANNIRFWNKGPRGRAERRDLHPGRFNFTITKYFRKPAFAVDLYQVMKIYGDGEKYIMFSFPTAMDGLEWRVNVFEMPRHRRDGEQIQLFTNDCGTAEQNEP